MDGERWIPYSTKSVGLFYFRYAYDGFYTYGYPGYHYGYESRKKGIYVEAEGER